VTGKNREGNAVNRRRFMQWICALMYT